MNQPADQSDQQTTLRTCEPFDPRRLRRQMRTDVIVLWAVALAVGIALVAAVQLGNSSLAAGGVIVFATTLLWFAVNSVSAKTWHELRQITALIDHAPNHAEDRLAGALKRWPLQRSVRLLIHHRLAMLRHRQQRFAETATIGAAVLRYRMGNAERIRAHLLLLMAESYLILGQLDHAYATLHQLYGLQLNLVESLQRMALQTRYEISAGQDDQALRSLDSKIELAELMPATQCGALHAMFAIAARRSEQTTLANWLQQRAELIGGREPLDKLAEHSAFLDMADLNPAQ
jgi:hypothetical protein